MRIAITGASGFVGTALTDWLISRGHSVVGLTRGGGAADPRVMTRTITGLDDSQGLRRAFDSAHVVVHLAARVHVMRDNAADPLAECRRVNVDGARAAHAAARDAGVRRFVLLSSVKAMGEGRALPYRESDPPAPADPYGISKLEAEQALLALAASTGIEVVIIRPPLVYGPGVGANFAALMRAVARGVPLPLGAVNNRRSLVAIDNLVDLINTCVEHPAAANEIFLVSDGEDLSTPELVRRLARAMGRPARLIPVPVPLLLAGAMLLGKRDVARRLLGSLQVDISKARSLLGWTPPVSVDEGLRRAVQSLGAKAT